MKIRFYYFYNPLWREFIPSCQIYGGEFNVLTNYISEVDIDFGVFCLDKLKNKNIHEFDISSESWGADIDDESVILFSLYDEENLEFRISITRESLTFLLKKWLDFIRLEKDENYEEVIDIN